MSNMYFDKSIKAHSYDGKERVTDVFTTEQAKKLGRLLYVYVKNLENYSIPHYTSFMRHIYIHFNLESKMDLRDLIPNMSLKQMFLLLETLVKIKNRTYKSVPRRMLSFLDDLNNFFLLERIPYQLIRIKKTDDFYIEKIIDDVHSEQIKQTLTKFSKYSKVHEDFKKAIMLFSAGDYPKSIEKCCISIEDYFCIILDKKSCHSIDSFYNEVRKKLNIPDDVDRRLKSIIGLIHSYRSKPLHGSKEIHEIDDLSNLNQLIIGFSMSILNYFYNIFEKHAAP